MAAPPARARSDYDYLIKLLLIGDSGTFRFSFSAIILIIFFISVFILFYIYFVVARIFFDLIRSVIFDLIMQVYEMFIFVKV